MFQNAIHRTVICFPAKLNHYEQGPHDGLVLVCVKSVVTKEMIRWTYLGWVLLVGTSKKLITNWKITTRRKEKPMVQILKIFSWEKFWLPEKSIADTKINE